MKTLVYPLTNEKKLLRDIIDNLSADVKIRIEHKKETILRRYKLYLDDFENITKRRELAWEIIEKNTLKYLYDKKIATQKNQIRLTQSVEFKNICPYCLFRSPDTFDHYLEKDVFPEFNILIKNLVPCCLPCNTTKENFEEDGQRVFLHFYIDPIPQIQFLNINLSFDQNFIPNVDFHIRHQTGIPYKLFKIIKSHFYKLKLLELYKENIDKPISEFTQQVQNYKTNGNLTTREVQNLLVGHGEQLAFLYGVNFWESILWKELAVNTQFINSL